MNTAGLRMCLIPDPGIRRRTSSRLWYSETGDQDVALIHNRRLRCWDLGYSATGWVQRLLIPKVHLCILSLPGSPLQAGDIIGSCLEAPQRPGPALICPQGHTHMHTYKCAYPNKFLTHSHTQYNVLFTVWTCRLTHMCTHRGGACLLQLASPSQ